MTATNIEWEDDLYDWKALYEVASATFTEWSQNDWWEDVLQDSAIDVLTGTKPEGLRAITWWLKVVRYKVLKMFYKNKLKPTESMDSILQEDVENKDRVLMMSELSYTEDTSRCTVQKDTKKMLSFVLHQDRPVIDMMLTGLSGVEIAEQLQVSPQRVQQIKSRAEESIRKGLRIIGELDERL